MNSKILSRTIPLTGAIPKAKGVVLGTRSLWTLFFFSDYSSIAQQKNTMDRWHGIGCKKSNITLSINKIRILSVLCGRWCKCKPVRSQSFTQSVSGYNEQKTHCVDKYLKQTYSLTLLLCFWNSVQVTHYSRLFYLRSNNRETSVWL